MSDCNKSSFINRMTFIINCNGKIIVKYGLCFMKGYFVLDCVGFRFVNIPFNPHYDSSISN